MEYNKALQIISYNMMIYGMDIRFYIKQLQKSSKRKKPVTRLAFLLQPSNDGSFRLLCINDQQKWIVFEKQGIGIVGCKCHIGGLSQSNH